MTVVFLVIHLFVALALIGVILLQKSEGGGLGMGGGGMSGFMTGRSTANLLTRTTAILTACFMLTSILLAILAGRHGTPRSIIDSAAPTAPAPPVGNIPAGNAPPAAPTPPASGGGAPAPASGSPAPASGAADPAAPSPPVAK